MSVFDCMHSLVKYLIVHSSTVIMSKNISVISCCDVGVEGGWEGGNMCYQSGMVSFATDTVGHAVGVLGVGLLDTDWTWWAGRSWSLWLLPACESLVRSAHGAASTGPPVRSWQLPSCLPVERRSCCTWSMLLRVVSVTSLKLCIKHSPLGRHLFEQIWSWRELHLLLSYAFGYLDSWGRWVHTCRI